MSSKGSSWGPKFNIGDVIQYSHFVYNSKTNKREPKLDILKVVGIDKKGKTYRFSYAHGEYKGQIAGEMDGTTIEEASSLLTASKKGGKRKSRKSRSKKNRRKTYRK